MQRIVRAVAVLCSVHELPSCVLGTNLSLPVSLYKTSVFVLYWWMASLRMRAYLAGRINAAVFCSFAETRADYLKYVEEW